MGDVAADAEEDEDEEDEAEEVVAVVSVGSVPAAVAVAAQVELPRVPARERATRSNGKNCRARAFFRELEKLASTRQLPFQHI